MERTANLIRFEHASRASREIRFVRSGKKGLHATGGVWGESDWFEFLHPSADEEVPGLKARIAEYLANGFVVAKTRIHDQRMAAALGFNVAVKPKAIAKAKTTWQGKADQLLSRTSPKTFEQFKALIQYLKALHARPLGNELRKKVVARLERVTRQLIRLAKRDLNIAARARRVLTPKQLAEVRAPRSKGAERRARRPATPRRRRK
jgi:hypothetical protein